MDEPKAEPRSGSLTSSAVRAAARAGMALGVSHARSSYAEASALLSGSAGEGGLSETGQGGGWLRSTADVAPGPATGVCLAVISGFSTGNQSPITAVSLSRSSNAVAVGDADGKVMVGSLTDMRVHRVLRTTPPDAALLAAALLASSGQQPVFGASAANHPKAGVAAMAGSTGLDAGVTGPAVAAAASGRDSGGGAVTLSQLGIADPSAAAVLAACPRPLGAVTTVAVSRAGLVVAYWRRVSLLCSWDLNGNLMAARHVPVTLTTSITCPGDGETAVAGTGRGTLVVLATLDLTLLREVAVAGVGMGAGIGRASDSNTKGLTSRDGGGDAGPSFPRRVGASADEVGRQSSRSRAATAAAVVGVAGASGTATGRGASSSSSSSRRSGVFGVFGRIFGASSDKDGGGGSAGAGSAAGCGDGELWMSVGGKDAVSDAARALLKAGEAVAPPAVTSVGVAEGGRVILVGDTLGRIRILTDPQRTREELTGRLQEGSHALM